MMGLLCGILGHKIPRRYYGYGEHYLDVKGSSVDGINRVHCYLYTECERCGEYFKVGNIHLPKLEGWVADLLKKKPNASHRAGPDGDHATTDTMPR